MQRLEVSRKLCLLASVVVLLSIVWFCGFAPAKNDSIAYAETFSVEAEIMNGGNAEETPRKDDGGQETVDNSTGDANKAPATFLSRVQGWFRDNLTEFFSGTTLASIIVAAIGYIVWAKKNKKLKAMTDALLASVELKTTNNTESNAEVIKAINALIAKYNEVQDYILSLDKYIAQFDNKELTRDTICNEMATLGKTILEILATVYANNQNIPQGVKDFVTLKYASALKAENEIAALQIQTEDSGGEEG